MIATNVVYTAHIFSAIPLRNISSKIQPQRHIPDTKRLQFLENAGAIKCWFLQGSLLINVILVFACLFFFLQIKFNPRNDIQRS
jgi:hypothetical protein